LLYANRSGEASVKRLLYLQTKGDIVLDWGSSTLDVTREFRGLSLHGGEI